MLPPDLRARLEDTIEALIALLDAVDGDCEDEGAQCDDLGWDSDSEPDEGQCVPTYQGDVDGTGSQSRVVSYLNR